MAVMPVPEAAMDEDHGSMLWKYEVRAAWKTCSAKSVPQPHRVQSLPN